jgi:hypothetical protein
MKRLLPLFASLACLALPHSAQAFVVLKNWNGETYRWASPNITWTLSTAVMDDVPLQALQAALTAAFQAWENVACSKLDFTYGGQKATDPNNGIHVTFRSNDWDPALADALAYSVSEVLGDGTIKSNDIVFNAFAYEWTNTGDGIRNDIQGVATHEVGHSFGLDHTRVRAATMFYAGGDTELRSLDEDDLNGACFLYPVGTFTAGQSCDECDEHSNCGVGTCFDWEVDGHAFCGNPCGPDFTCDHGLTCFELDGYDAPLCLPDNDFDGTIDECHVAGRDAELGDYCYGDDVCASGQCLVWGDDAYCTASCNPDNLASCGPGYACMRPGFCVKAGDKAYGEVCEDSDECATAFCFWWTAAHGICTTLCETREQCPGNGQCDGGEVCVPPGEAGIGTPCETPAECRGTYCEDGLCTARCESGCPAGTACVQGFCEGVEVGAPCSATGQCPDGLACVGEDAPSCVRKCDALTGSGCGDDEVCTWHMEGSRVSGLCAKASGGRGVGEGCADGACERDLVCHGPADGSPTCARDCRSDSGFGCLSGERCAALPGEPLRGACEPKPVEDPLTEPDAVTPPVEPDAGPEATARAPNSDGCAGGAASAAAGLLLGLVAVGTRRRMASR